MEFIDRVSAYPNRYLLTDENGNAYYVVLERADEPTKVGTPLNAETFNNMMASLYQAMEDSDYPGCYYRMVGGEKEWINPPMRAGWEYRTTERFLGKPVYTCAFDLGRLPNETVEFMPFNCGYDSRLLSVAISDSRGRLLKDGDWGIRYIRVSSQSMEIETNEDLSHVTAIAIAKYVKEQ